MKMLAKLTTLLFTILLVACGGGGKGDGLSANSTARAQMAMTLNAAVVPDSGVWWNPAESGRGYTIEAHGNILVFYTFLFHETGYATWYGGAIPLNADGSYSGKLQEYMGGQTLTGAYKGPPTVKRDATDIRLACTTPTSCSLTWAGGTVPIQRFLFGGTARGVNPPESGLWWNPAESGRGYIVDLQGSTFAFYAYLFDPSGNATWYMTAGEQNADGTYDGQMQEYFGGQTLTGAYQGSPTVKRNASPVHWSCTTPTTCTMIWAGGTVPLQRFWADVPATPPGPTVPAWEYRSTAFMLQQSSKTSLQETLANFKDWLQAYKSLGLNAITLVAWIPVDPATGSIKATYDNAPWPNMDPKAKTPEYFASFTQAAKQVGMKVIWKPHFVLDDKTNNNVSDWALGSSFYPQGTTFNVNNFLDGVNIFWQQWAAIAEREKVDLLIIGTEHLNYASGVYTQKWRKIISTVRSVYTGKLTYAENHFEPFEGSVKVEFWDALDYIGIDDYIPIGNGTANTPYESAYVNIFESRLGFPDKPPTNNIPDILCKLHKIYNKPIIFTEFGTVSRDGAMNWPSFVAGKTNLTEQEIYFKANFDVWTNFSWVSGLSFWNQENEWSDSPTKTDFLINFNTYVLDGYEFYNKPAANVLKDYWISVKNPPEIPTKYKTPCL